MAKDNTAETKPRQSRLVLALGVAILLLGFVPFGWYLAVLITLFALLTIRVSRKDAGGIILALCVSFVLGHVSAPWHVQTLSRWREEARRATCKENLKAIAAALHTYAAGNDGFLPPDLQTLVTETYVQDGKRFSCPSTTHEPRTGENVADYGAYVYFGRGRRSGDASALLVADRPGNHGGDGRNVVYGDGRVSWQSPPPEAD